MSLAAAAAEALAREPAALVTVLATEGSAPRGAGTRMLVTAEALVGTIGGGALEWQAAQQARLMLGQPVGNWRVQDYPLGPLLGQCCGGRVRLLVERLEKVGWLAAVEAGGSVVTTLGATVGRDSGAPPSSSCRARPGIPRATYSPAAGLEEPWMPEPVRHDGRGEASGLSARGPLPTPGFTFIEPLDTPRRPLMLFGAGHVGRAIAALVPGLPLALAWYDSRPEADAPGVVVQDEAALVACAGEARADAAVLVLTHDHGLDYRLTAAALASKAGFVGLIGSATKRARFVARLRAEGVDPGRLTCPIGTAGIHGKEPAVIAVAAVAQLLSLRQEAA